MFKKVLLATSLMVLGTMGLVNAQTAATETYLSDTKLSPGLVVSLVEGEQSKVETASLESADRLFGVVVKQTDSSLRLEDNERTTFVTTFGTAATLVTDYNGTVSAGDKLTISPVSGIAMKAADGEQIIGTALENFDENSLVISTKTLNDNQRGETQAKIGSIKVQVNPQANRDNFLPGFITSFSESVAGKPVDPVRIYAATGLTFVTIATSSVIVAGAVKSAMTAIGRNPLSKKFVYKGLFQVMGVVLLISIIGMGAAYLVIKL